MAKNKKGIVKKAVKAAVDFSGKESKAHESKESPVFKKGEASEEKEISKKYPNLKK